MKEVCRLNGFFSAVNGFFVQISNMSFSDILDIVIVSFMFYYIYKFIKDRRAGKLALGIVFVLVVMVISRLLNLYVLNFFIDNIIQVGIIGVVILFQAELRTFLESIAVIGEGLGPLGAKRDRKNIKQTQECIKVIVDASFALSAEKTGALMVFERGSKLGDVINTGTVINADPVVYLLKNIFFNKAPLHDGALIIKDNRLHAAGCFLPLSQSSNLMKDLGTRHRAAVGMSENSDAVVVVVSEETGSVSLAEGGKLMYNLNASTLHEKLVELLVGKSDEETDNTNEKGKIDSVKTLVSELTAKIFKKNGGER